MTVHGTMTAKYSKELTVHNMYLKKGKGTCKARKELRSTSLRKFISVSDKPLLQEIDKKKTQGNRF